MMLIGVILIQFFPLVYMVSISFKSLEHVFSEALNIIPSAPTTENYKYVMDSVPMFNFIWNTLIISTLITIGKVGTSVLAAYVLTFKNFKGKRIVFFLILITLFVPFTATMIPNYITISNMGLLNTSIGVVLPQLADATGIILMVQAMRQISKSLIEVAKLDKITELQTLFYLVLPMIKNTVVALGILFFINSWNEYFWPLLILSTEESYTLSLALQLFLSAEGGSNWGTIMAIAVIASITPIILYILCQRMIIASFVKSGIKG